MRAAVMALAATNASTMLFNKVPAECLEEALAEAHAQIHGAARRLEANWRPFTVLPGLFAKLDELIDRTGTSISDELYAVRTIPDNTAQVMAVLAKLAISKAAERASAVSVENGAMRAALEHLSKGSEATQMLEKIEGLSMGGDQKGFQASVREAEMHATYGLQFSRLMHADKFEKMAAGVLTPGAMRVWTSLSAIRPRLVPRRVRRSSKSLRPHISALMALTS